MRCARSRSTLELHEERLPVLGSRNGRRVTGTGLRHHPEPRRGRCPVRGRLQRHNATREKTVLTVAHLEDDAWALQRAALGPPLNRHPFTHASLLCWSSRSDRKFLARNPRSPQTTKKSHRESASPAVSCANLMAAAAPIPSASYESAPVALL